MPEYDFVIVGAGSAGSALASRLTENRNVTVLLVEAGKPEMLLTDIPAMAPYFQATDYTWQYYMEPQPGVCMGKTCLNTAIDSVHVHVTLNKAFLGMMLASCTCAKNV